MNKKSGWTLAELTVSLMIIAVISVLGIVVIKPKDNKAKVFVYATIKNISKANSYLFDKFDVLDSSDMTVKNVDLDPYCIHIADSFSLKGTYNCNKSATVDTVNFTMANGVTIQGLASDWIEPFPNAKFYFKNIAVDIDGPSGVNKLGIDRFPLRIYKNEAYNGIVTMVDCEQEQIFDPIDQATVYNLASTEKAHKYCYDGFNPSGARVKHNFLKDNSIISYNVYRAVEETVDDKIVKSLVLATSVSIMEADCIAYGGTGLFSRRQCSQAGYRLQTKCAQTDICEDCKGSDYDVCPKRNPDDTAALDVEGCKALIPIVNPNDLGCITFIARPTQGLGILATMVSDEIGM